MTGLSTLVSPTKRLVVVVLAAITTVVVNAPNCEAANLTVPVPLLFERVTVVLDDTCTGLPYKSCSSTVTGPRFAVDEVDPDTGLVVNATWLAVAGLTVTEVPLPLLIVPSVTVTFTVCAS
jgi:hypothetical protein